MQARRKPRPKRREEWSRCTGGQEQGRRLPWVADSPPCVTGRMEDPARSRNRRQVSGVPGGAGGGLWSGPPGRCALPEPSKNESRRPNPGHALASDGMTEFAQTTIFPRDAGAVLNSAGRFPVFFAVPEFHADPNRIHSHADPLLTAPARIARGSEPHPHGAAHSMPVGGR